MPSEPSTPGQDMPNRDAAAILDFPVVGIGASAGGVEALLTFFNHAPASMDLAFVVILHLPAEPVSHIDEVLRRVSRLPVSQVTGATKIEKDHVYIIPPGKYLSAANGYLRVTERTQHGGAPVAIDVFFRTLADAHGTRAMGIVLSGTGSDGAVGLSRIKEAGGMTIAQEPTDAAYPEMPHHAIATGHVDFVLPVAAMPRKLVELWRNVQSIQPINLEAEEEAEGPAEPAREESEKALHDVLMHLRVRTGHDFRHYKRATVLRRIERRMQVNGVHDLMTYRNLLRTTPAETSALLADMLIGVTQFFRDRDAFEALRRDVVHGLFRPSVADPQVRVWVAGCSTGEEAYSIAVLLAQERDAANSATAVQVFATDIDEAAIARARAGVYPGSVSADIPGPMLAKFFVRDGVNFRIVKPIREKMLFAVHSLLRDPPFSQLHLISCRNVLIYLDRSVQRQILELFHFALRPDGYLFLGTAESADSADDLFVVVDKKNRIYRARPALGRVKTAVGFPLLSVSDQAARDEKPITLPVASTAQPPADRRSFSFSALHQRVLEEYAPPSVIIDRESTIVHLSDTAGRFLHHAGGEPSNNIMELVLPELRLDLRTTLFRALQTGASVEARRVRLVRGEQASWINMTVRPFHDAGLDADFFLVLFDEVQERMTDEGEEQDGGRDPVLIQLDHELQLSREQLATTIEQYETSVEELKASNEELQAINEELRSATEELESSKEELQSVNEELTTVNTELQNRIEDTAKANDDLQNIIVSTDIATVFVDKKFLVKRFTANATRIFKLIDTDIGRSLFDITHALQYPTLAEDVKQSFETLKLIEREIQSSEGRWYLVRLLPYRTADDRIDGTVLTLIDITARHEAEEAARRGEERLRLVAQSTADYAIIVQDPQGAIVTWNAGAERIFGYTESEVVGRNVSLIYGPGDDEQQAAARERETALRDGRADDERWHVTKDERRVYCSGVVTPISDAAFTGFAKIARDLTERKRREDSKQQALEHERQQREKEVLSNQLKDDFIAVLSHELKHPLNLIGVKAEMLPRLPEARGLVSVRETADSIRRAVRTQAQIIDDLLDLSRIRTGKLALELARVDLVALIASVADAVEEDACARGISLSVDFGDVQAPAHATADPVRCEQILWNLVSNALKFTDARGHISIRLRREQTLWRIDVIDDGQGIDGAMLPYVFEMFRQGRGMRDASKGGLGIGLALVKQLAQMHGGRVAARSDGHGKGTAMTVWLPVAEERGGIGAAATQQPGSIDALRVLIVEDDRETAATLSKLLELEHASVRIVLGASEALAALTREPVDVLLAAFPLRDRDGGEFVRNVRAVCTPEQLKMIVLSAGSREQNANAKPREGVDLQLVKPLDFDELLHALMRLTGRDVS
ncbi:chemotaxis protein CheB [Paraburkholderia rhizosphaerae]|uniref:histidine kinase n=1 Tax=Paraburkholderia rhizosphaerae TaxID=480658 RepID=A0A4R8LLL1_9BURK|nr:chemotaxis protein CheB [Paraburkholderia rhizosphaerae]TDY43897.1 two-component system CheB/CheR fusion protein [Paraburkholderia rhizosphaerae]